MSETESITYLKATSKLLSVATHAYATLQICKAGFIRQGITRIIPHPLVDFLYMQV